MKFLSNILVKAGLVVEGSAQFNSLAGVGTRMVVTNAAGVVSTQAIPLVNSVFGRTGAVVAQAGDYTTAQVTESGNLYYTDARARAAISVAGSGTYNPSTGVITINGGVTSVNTLTGAVVLTTSNISEGTNLYYTDARARASISLTTTGGSGAATYIGGVLNIPNYTLAGLGGVGGTGVANELAYFSTPSVIGNLPVATYPSLTEISYVKGVTSSIQTQINSKQNTITLTTTGTSGAATLIGNTLNIPNYTSAANVTGSAATGQMAFWTGASAIGGNANFVWDNAQSRLGVNIATPLHTIDVAGSARITGTVAIASSAFNQAGAESSIHIGRSMTAQTSYGSTIRYEAQTGVLSAHGMQVQLSTQNALFTVANIYGISVLGTIKGASNTITNQYGFFVNSTLNAATNNYAFYGDIGVGAGMWNVYMAGSASNYFAGRVLIGGATDDNTNALQVAGSFIATSNSTINSVSVGRGAGNVATNTALGASALLSNTSGLQNTAVGNDALRLNTTGLQNSAFGYRASRATTTGSANSSFGIDTLRLNSIGNYNSAFGAQALDNNTSNNNTAIGSQSLLDNTTGTNNTALGYRAGYAGSLLSNVTGSNNIFIGADSIGESTSESNRTFIGNTSTTSTWLGGRLLLGSRTDNTAYGFINNKLLTGSTIAISNGSEGQIQTDVTAGAFYYRTISNQIAGSSLTSIIHYAASQGTLSGTSANQYGFYAYDLSGSTSNYGFFGTVSSGVRKYNLYMNGTANNFMNGALLIGGDVNNDYLNKFQVVGTSSLNGVTYINTNASIAGYGHSLQVLANAAGGMVISTTNSASGIGIINSSSSNKTWDISPFNNNLAINESGIANGTRMYFAAGGNVLIGSITDDAVNKLQVTGSISATLDSVINGVTIGKGGGSGALNTAVGSLALSANTTGASNTAFGLGALASITTGSDNVGIGTNAGRYRNGTTVNDNSSGGVYIGNASRASATATTNEIVIGAGAQGNGDNTVTIGNTGIVSTALRGNVTTNGSVRSDITQTAQSNNISISLLGSNITTYPSGFFMNAAGYGLNAIYAQHEHRFGGNALFLSANIAGGGLIINKFAPTAAGTVTVNQIPTTGTVTNIRTMSNLHLMTQFEGNNNLTVTHMSGLHIYGNYRTSGTGVITVSGAYYGILLADPNEFGAGATITGSNYGFYQQGAAPFNHFGGKVIIGTTATDGTSKLRITGLPTSATGLLAGEVWNNGGVLTIV